MKHKIISFITVALLAIIFNFYWGSPQLVVNIAAVITLYLLITVYGSFQIKANYFVNSICSGSGNGVAFSFDDGPDPETTLRILEILRLQKATATFFIIGEKAEKYPELVKAIYDDGHIIANHSYSHRNEIGFFGSKKLIADLQKCSVVIEQITGKRPLFFRPPFGVTNPRFSKVLTKLNLVSIGWSGRSFDTITNSKKALLKRVKKSIFPGAILLFHDTQKVTLEALPDMINYCKEKGINIVSLQELINKNPYAAV